MSKRPRPSYLIFPDANGEWSWNFASPKGRVIASSEVSYSNPQGCIRAICLLQGSATVPVLVRKLDNEVVMIGDRSQLGATQGDNVLELNLEQIQP